MLKGTQIRGEIVLDEVLQTHCSRSNHVYILAHANPPFRGCPGKGGAGGGGGGGGGGGSNQFRVTYDPMFSSASANGSSGK